MPIHEISGEEAEWPAEEDWGDEAMLEWRADEGSIVSGMDDDASSVAREDAGLLSDDEEEDDDDNDWGQDAVMTWEDMGIEGGSDRSDLSESKSDELEPTEETEDDLLARGMPTYRNWTVKKLQVSGIVSDSPVTNC